MTINLRAILLGAGADLGGTAFFGAIITSAWAYTLRVQGVAQDQLYPTLIGSPWFLLASLVIGLAFSFIGGHVAASMARTHHSAYGAASAIPCLVVGLLEVLSPFGTILPMWLVWSGKAGSLLFAFLGGRHARANAASLKKHLPSN